MTNCGQFTGSRLKYVAESSVQSCLRFGRWRWAELPGNRWGKSITAGLNADGDEARSQAEKMMNKSAGRAGTPNAIGAAVCESRSYGDTTTVAGVPYLSLSKELLQYCAAMGAAGPGRARRAAGTCT